MSDPFLFHASPVDGGGYGNPGGMPLTQPQGFAANPFGGYQSGVYTMANGPGNSGEGSGHPDNPMPLPPNGIPATTPPTSTTPATPTQYGAGFGSLDQNFTLKDFQTDPGYQWRMDQGIQALDRSASARGLLFSGGELKALDRYNQGFASNEYNNAFNRWNLQGTNRFNRLAALSGIGQTAQSQLTNYAGNMAGYLNGNILGAGNAASAGAIAQGAANQNAMNGLGNAWMYYLNNHG